MAHENVRDEDIEALLPWYVNGTLSADEKEQVEQALKRSENLREELAFLQNVSSSVKAETPPEVSELGWRRLQKQIQKEESVQPDQDSVQKAKSNWFRPFIASAAVVVIALQVNFSLDPGKEDSTRLLSSPSVVLAEPHWRLQLEIADQATWEEVYALTNMLNASIIDGPSSLGIISIAVPHKNSRYQNIEELMAWLEQQALISYVSERDEQE